MIINLKQSEIEAALKGYITQQGISLGGKQVTVSFTAGRKESGVSAELSIEDDGTTAIEPVQDIPPTGMIKRSPELVVVQEEETNDAEPVEEAEPVKTSSLFG